MLDENIAFSLSGDPPAADALAVSVIIRTKDRPELLRTAMASVAAQTRPGIELLVVNDGGQDVEALVAGQARGGIARVVYHALQPGQGRSAAGNTGLALATGDALLFLDDDDWLLPEHVANLAAALAQHPACVAAYSNTCCVVLREGEWVPLFEFNEAFDPVRFAYENYLPIHSVLFRKSALDADCRLPETLDLYEDWAFWLLLSQRGEFVHVDQPGAVYRIAGQSGMGLPGADADTTAQYRAFVHWAKSRWTDQQAAFLVKIASGLRPREREFEQMRQAAGRLRAALAEQEAHAARLVQALEEREAHTQRVEEALAFREAQVDGLYRELAEWQGRLENLGRCLADEQGRAEGLGRALAEQQAQAENLGRALAEQQAQAENLGRALAEREAQVAGLEQALAAVLHSTSWRLTAPVRQALDAAKRLRPGV